MGTENRKVEENKRKTDDPRRKVEVQKVKVWSCQKNVNQFLIQCFILFVLNRAIVDYRVSRKGKHCYETKIVCFKDSYLLL